MAPLPIIETKLSPSFVSGSLLPRERLVNRLLEGAGARLLVVHGEAGAGKSSLLYDFTRRHPLPVAWYSLQEMDQDLRVFLTYLVEALERSYPGSATACRRLLAAAPVPADGWETVLTTLVNDLARHGKRVSLVLDDYHVVQDTPEVASAVTFLVRNAPTGFQLALATRHTPQLALPFLRAKGLLVEISADDLRFSADEVEAVFRDIWRVPIGRAVAETLVERTEGWVTGLQLVAQALRSRPAGEIARYVDDLQGKDQFIYDYLATEVYALQPPEVRSFLKKTSILSRFDARLAEAVSESADSQARLRYLEDCRLFLVHLDDNRQWFRYHHLFTDFLRRTFLSEEGSAAVRGLHELAARWFERQGDTASAVSHYMEAENSAAAVRLLEQRGAEMLARGQQQRLESWLDEIPRDSRDSSPELTVLRGDLRELAGDWVRASELYERAVNEFRGRGRHGEVARVLERLMLCFVRYGESDRVVQSCEAALAACPEDDLARRASLSAWLGAILVYTGNDWNRGYDLIRDSHQMAFQSGDPRSIAWACVTYGFAFHFPRGNFLDAEKALNEGIELFRSLGWSPMLYRLLMNKSVVLVVGGQLERARELIEDTLAVAENAGHIFVAQALQLSRAMLYLETGELHRCSECFSRMSERGVPTQIRLWYYRTLLLLRIQQGSMQLAKSAAEEIKRALVRTNHGMYAPECLLALGYYHSLRREMAEAERVLLEALALSRRGSARFWEMRAHLMLASLLQESRPDRDQVRKHLKEAFALTREHDYFHFWLSDTWGVCLPLLLQAVASHIEDEFARELLSRFGDRLTALLQPLANHADARLRSVVYEYLGRIESDDAVATLLGGRHDRSQQVRSTVRKSLLQRKGEPVSVALYTMGRFDVLRNDTPITWSRRLTRRILKFLIARYEASVAPDAFIEAFWPDVPPERGRRNLTVNMNYLRKDVHGGNVPARFLVVNDDVGYRLRLEDGVWLDLAEFDRLVAEGRDLDRAGDAEAAHARFLRAEALCAGGFICDDLYEDWLESRRERVSLQYRETVSWLARHALDRGAPAQAVTWYRKQLLRNPLDEGTLQDLLRCHAAGGDRASARQDFEQFRAALVQQFDEEPSFETRVLAESLLGGA